MCVCACVRLCVLLQPLMTIVVHKAHQVIELRGLFIRHHFLPVALPHCGDRRLHELAVDTPAGVGDDEQLIPPVFDRVSVVLGPAIKKKTSPQKKLSPSVRQSIDGPRTCGSG